MTHIEVHATPEVLATTVAQALLERLATEQHAGRVPQIGLTGGTIADLVHRELARLSPPSGVDWSQVVVWWGDERFVEGTSPDRNELQAREAFLDVVGVDPSKVHAVPSASEASTAEASAEQYAATMRTQGTDDFTVLMLGVGPDAHIASLFPGHPALDVEDHIAVAVHDSPKPPPDRVSLTFAALNHADEVWFLASGDGKAEAVAKVLDGSGDVHDAPARGVSGTSATIWHLDQGAASALA